MDAIDYKVSLLYNICFMTDVLSHTHETLLAPRSRAEADMATGSLPLVTQSQEGEASDDMLVSSEPVIKDPDTLRDIRWAAEAFQGEIDDLLTRGTDVSRGAWCLAMRATNGLLEIDTQNEASANERLNRAWEITEELARKTPPANVVPEPTRENVPLEATPIEELPDAYSLVQDLSAWHEQNPHADRELRKSVEWTRDALNASATEARLRDGAFLLLVVKELERNSPS